MLARTGPIVPSEARCGRLRGWIDEIRWGGPTCTMEDPGPPPQSLTSTIEDSDPPPQWLASTIEDTGPPAQSNRTAGWHE